DAEVGDPEVPEGVELGAGVAAGGGEAVAPPRPGRADRAAGELAGGPGDAGVGADGAEQRNGIRVDVVGPEVRVAPPRFVRGEEQAVAVGGVDGDGALGLVPALLAD